jgi:hypothetical protein|tara:strand:+ start:510 stop:686 length:177 start_codon:yes stop_codon:yes gene_type:complete
MAASGAVTMPMETEEHDSWRYRNNKGNIEAKLFKAGEKIGSFWHENKAKAGYRKPKKD